MSPIIFITAKDVAQLFSCTVRTAQRKIQHYRIAHQKEKRHKILLDKFCDYYDIPLEKALKTLLNMTLNDFKR